MYVLFMEEDTQLRDIFPDLERYLSGAGAAMQAPESHGVLCARYCMQERPDPEAWVEDVLGPVDESDLTQRECRQKLTSVYEITDRIFDSGMDEPVLLLPHDDATLQQRSQALADWCSGFIAELGMSGLQVDELARSEIQEILRDLIEITHIDEQIEDLVLLQLAVAVRYGGDLQEEVRVAIVSDGLDKVVDPAQ